MRKETKEPHTDPHHPSFIHTQVSIDSTQYLTPLHPPLYQTHTTTANNKKWQT